METLTNYYNTIINEAFNLVKTKSSCSNKCILGHVYYYIYLRLEGKLPFSEHVIANTVSLGNKCINQTKSQMNPNDCAK
ncbi:hypothetical protein H8356DRAFT_1345711 [Neocallimastix lanati (nom. inval.)]|nr:hypothetical protein H8356DRAFT_1345711 [Neocallimastix sp. JGI-2020a]